MKKLYMIIMVCTMLCCAACNWNSTSQGDSGKLSDGVSAGENTEASQTHTLPPYILRFYSFDEITEMKAMLKKSDAEFAAYLEEKPYDEQGTIDSKEDIMRILASIEDINILHLEEASGYKLHNIAYNITYGLVLSTYQNGDGKLMRFRSYIDVENQKSKAEASAEVQAREVVNQFAVSGFGVDVYAVSQTDPREQLVGRLVNSDSYITIQAGLQNTEAIYDEKVRENLILVSLSSFIR